MREHPGSAELPGIVIAAGDYDRLTDLTSTSEQLAPGLADYFARELGRARVVPDREFDRRAARVGSRVTYSDDQSGRRRSVTLVWPERADVQSNRISVLTSIGAALLGLRGGQSIDWPSPMGGTHTLTVFEVDNDSANEPAPSG